MPKADRAARPLGRPLAPPPAPPPRFVPPPASAPSPWVGTSLRPSALLAAAAVAALGGAWAWPADGGWARGALAACGALLLAGSLGHAALTVVARARRRVVRTALAALVERDGAATYVTDAGGEVLSRNRAAGRPPRDGATGSLADALASELASPGALVHRLQSEAAAQGSAQEDLVTRRGHVRLSAHRVDADHLLWRLEDLGVGAGRPADALSLPMMTVEPGGTILFMNEAFRRITTGRPRHIDRVFLDLPLVSGRVHRVDGPDGPVEGVVAQVPSPGGRRDVFLLPAHAGGAASPPGASWDAIEDLPVPLLKVARTGKVLASNREARALLPMPIGPDTRLSDLLEGLGRPVIDWLTDVAEGRPTPGPQMLRGAGAHQDTFLRVALSLAGPSDDPYLIAVLNDVTELKSLEAQFVQSQKMQAIGQLAGGVAHDFNNLLTAIAGHCDLLLVRHDPSDGDYADLIQIRQNSNRAASLVSQLLAFSRKQNLMLETLDLRDTLSDLAHLLNRLVGERVQLTLRHDPELQHIRADKRQLEQVIMNLVVNARDAMPEGGEIRIETENRVLAEPLERDRATVPPGAYVVIRTIDQGTGIPPDRLPKIFEPFYTTKRPGEGTGLGLSTAYGIVKQTGGFIFADSEVGRGTTFTIWLPGHGRTAPAAAPPKAPPPAAPMRRSQGVVLLVEDEAPVRAFASRALRLSGYTVLEADSAEAALELLADPDLHVDLFVTDVIMPGKDGPTWVREALRDRPSTKVVFVSGYAEEAFGEHQALIPNSVFLPKPFSLGDLTSVVHEQLSATT